MWQYVMQVPLWQGLCDHTVLSIPPFASPMSGYRDPKIAASPRTYCVSGDIAAGEAVWRCVLRASVVAGSEPARSPGVACSSLWKRGQTRARR